MPLALDLVEDPDDKEVLKIALIRQSMGRPYTRLVFPRRHNREVM